MPPRGPLRALIDNPALIDLAIVAVASGLAGFVRIVFIVVVSALIVKTAYDAFFPH